MLDYYDSYLDAIVTYLDSIEDLLVRLDYAIGKNENLLTRIDLRLEMIEGKMDKKIKSAKKIIDKKMDSLVKADIKRDKDCDAKMMKKKK